MNRSKIHFISLVLIVFLLNNSCAFGQSSTTVSAKKQLMKTIQIHSGEITVGKLMTELSLQTGIKIFAAKYLLEHQLTLNMTGVSAKHILDSLCEMHNWRWVSFDDKEVFVSHQLQPHPTDMVEFPNAFRAVYPRAWLPFLGENIDLSKQLTSKSHDLMQTRIDSAREIEDPGHRKEEEERIEKAKFRLNVRGFYDRKGNSDVGMAKQKLNFPEDKTRYLIGMQLKYPQWTDQVRQGVINTLLLSLLIGPQIDDTLQREWTSGKLREYLIHPEHGVIGFSGGFFSFGEMVKSSDGKLYPAFGVGQAIQLPAKSDK